MKRNHQSRQRGKIRRLTAAVLLLGGTLAAAQVVTAAPAAAVPGLEVRTSSLSALDSISPKIQIARCPAGKRLVGGGAWAGPNISAADETKVMLTGVEPLLDTTNGDGFMATAYERGSGIAGTWNLEAYAICANAVPGLEIVSTSTTPSSTTFKATAAQCPSGKRVLSTGTVVPDAGGKVGLVLNRADSALGISRSSAREDTAGYSGQWTLRSYAVCANPVGADPQGPPLANDRVETYTCAPNSAGTPTFAHGVGGGGGLIDTGAFFLQVLYPSGDKKSIQVVMTGTPTGGMAVQAICAP